MVLEEIMSVKDIIKNPWHMMVFGAIISLISLGISYLVFPQHSGLLAVFLVTIISAPFMWKLMKYEEWHEEADLRRIKTWSQRLNPIDVFSRQKKIFFIYAAFFAGIVIAMSFIFYILPDSVSEEVFNDQRTQIQKISSIVGSFSHNGIFVQIFANNMIVLTMSFLFALIFGGAIFILAWNASILAAAIGAVSKISGAHIAILEFLPHGIFEIAGYLIAAITGGIISAAIIKNKQKVLKPVITDMIIFMLPAVLLIFIGAVIETSSF